MKTEEIIHQLRKNKIKITWSCIRSEGDQGRSGKRMLCGFVLVVFLFLMLAAVMPTRAAAEETERKAGWRFGADFYLWGAGLGGKTASGDNFDVSFSDLLSKLKFGFMGGLHAYNGKWHLSTDVLYMQLEADNSGQLTVPDGSQLKLNATLKLQAWVVTPALGYSVIDTEPFRMEILAGARYLYINPELEFQLPRGERKNFSDSGNIWDGIVGIRGEVNLSKNWYLPYYLDMGAGNSKFTWQAIGGVGYRINKTVDVVATYRYLEWTFNDNKILDTLNMSGPLIGVRFQF